MFKGCSSLKELDLSNFKTHNVYNMSFMFYGCSSLKRLELANFKTDEVIYMKYMFFKCESLEFLNIRNFVPYNDIETDSFLDGCPRDLDILINLEMQKKIYHIRS